MSGDDRQPMGPPPVEPLSDIAWARVEKQLFATLDCDGSAPIRVPTRSWSRWAIAGGALAAVAAAVIAVVVVTGDDAAAPPPIARAATPSHVVTEDAASSVTFGEAAITVAAHSAITLHGGADDGVLVVLERGAATFEVAPRAGRPAFVVQAGEATVRVVGTRFTVERSGDAASVYVTEGHVEAVARGLRAQVRAGESWSSGGGDREAAAGGPAAPPGDIAAAPFVAEDEPEPPAPPKPKAEPKPEKIDPKVAFERASALEASDPRAALKAYRSLARGAGPWAANALYAAGRLAAELDDRATAIKLLDRYLREYPKGANAADARALRRSLDAQ